MLSIIIPIAIVVALGIFIVKRKNKSVDTNVITGIGGGKPSETNHTQEK